MLFFGFFKGGSMLLILLVFCVVVFLGGVYVVDLVSFLCCGCFFVIFVVRGSRLLILLVFCVVFCVLVFWGEGSLCCSSW